MEKKEGRKEEKNNLKALKKKLKECEKFKQEYLAGWQRARADFLNYKKDEEQRIKRFLELEREGFILELLPLLDSFEKAKKELPENLKDNDYIKGFLQIYQQFWDFLKKEGVERIESLGKKFNPNFHEAVGEVKEESKEPSIIVEEIQAGYKLKEKLLRPAKVKVVK